MNLMSIKAFATAENFIIFILIFIEKWPVQSKLPASPLEEKLLATDTPGQLDVLGHDGHTLGMDGAQVGVLKETNQVSLRSLLKGHDSAGLETQISLEVLGNLTDKTLEGQLADEKLSGLLVATDLTEGHSTRAIPVGLLDSTSGRG